MSGSTIQPFGNPFTNTYGQTFVADAAVGLHLLDFTFFVTTAFSGTLFARGYVCEWTGPLQGNGGRCSVIVFREASVVPIVGSNTGTLAKTVTLPAPLQLQDGAAYCAFLSITDPADSAQSTGTTTLLFASSHFPPTDGNGGFVGYIW